VNASCSMFSQILKLIPRIEFERLVKETGSEYASKGLSSWSQFVAMMFCQLGRAHSLREAWFQPYSESMVFLWLLMLRNALAIAALARHTTTTVLFPAMMTAACLALISVMVWRRLRAAPSHACIRS
jgi:hypothetical protein